MTFIDIQFPGRGDNRQGQLVLGANNFTLNCETVHATRERMFSFDMETFNFDEWTDKNKLKKETAAELKKHECDNEETLRLQKDNARY